MAAKGGITYESGTEIRRMLSGVLDAWDVGASGVRSGSVAVLSTDIWAILSSYLSVVEWYMEKMWISICNPSV
jgi:hypothetical protein